MGLLLSYACDNMIWYVKTFLLTDDVSDSAAEPCEENCVNFN